MSRDPITSPQPSTPVRIRPARPGDRPSLLALASRLVIGIAPWRDPSTMLGAMQRFIMEDLDRMGPQSTMLVAEAEAEHGAPLGFVSIAHHVNFTGETQAYIGELAVREDAEGQGVGRALVHAAESWAREQGYTLVVLDTGAANPRARAFYQRLGYREESVRLTKPLAPAGRENP
jgi:GNAT superfamily N-acetyltransferase